MKMKTEKNTRIDSNGIQICDGQIVCKDRPIGTRPQNLQAGDVLDVSSGCIFTLLRPRSEKR